jgi:hypothetical protein
MRKIPCKKGLYEPTLHTNGYVFVATSSSSDAKVEEAEVDLTEQQPLIVQQDGELDGSN